MQVNLDIKNFNNQCTKRIEETIAAISNAKSQITKIEEVSNLLINAFKNDKKLLICGNGGSAADAQHIAAEMVGKFYKINRKGLPAIALNTNTSSITAIANDFGYDDTFKRGVDAFGQEGDVFWGISTSGNSKNILEAIDLAKQRGLKVVSLTGETGGEMAKKSDITITIDSQNTPIIQNAHITISHIICELVESQF